MNINLTINKLIQLKKKSKHLIPILLTKISTISIHTKIYTRVTHNKIMLYQNMKQIIVNILKNLLVYNNIIIKIQLK